MAWTEFKGRTQLAFYVNLHRAIIGPSATLTGRWRPDIDLRRMLPGYKNSNVRIVESLFMAWLWRNIRHKSGNSHLVGTDKERMPPTERLLSVDTSLVLWDLRGKHSLFVYGHYEDRPIQIYWKFHHQKLKKKKNKNSDIFHISAQNIDCGCSLEPPRWGGSNEYPQSMFLSRKKKKIMYTPVNPSVTI